MFYVVPREGWSEEKGSLVMVTHSWSGSYTLTRLKDGGAFTPSRKTLKELQDWLSGRFVIAEVVKAELNYITQER